MKDCWYQNFSATSREYSTYASFSAGCKAIPAPNSPFCLKRVVYDGTHTGDWIPIKQSPPLLREVTLVLGSSDILTQGEKEFFESMKRLCEASIGHQESAYNFLLGWILKIMTIATRTNPLSYLTSQLDELRAKGTHFKLRVLDDEQAPLCTFDGKKVINLASNNYLGLTTHPKLREAALEATKSTASGQARYEPSPAR